MAVPDSKAATKDINILECPVCYQECVHPVKLPCNHIFCYLCVKGVVTRTRKCAMCRLAIPIQYLENPDTIDKSGLDFDQSSQDEIQWFYQARRRGWWLYEKRIASEIEQRYHEDPKAVFELQIAGFLYVIDLENMQQYRKEDRNVSRAIKRDHIKDVKEVQGKAGLRPNNSSSSLSSRTVEGSPSPEDCNPVPNSVPPISYSVSSSNPQYRLTSSSGRNPPPAPPGNVRQPVAAVDISYLVADMNLIDRGNNSDTDNEPESRV